MTVLCADAKFMTNLIHMQCESQPANFELAARLCSENLKIAASDADLAVEIEPAKSKSRTYNGRVGPRRLAKRPGWVPKDRVPTELNKVLSYVLSKVLSNIRFCATIICSDNKGQSYFPKDREKVASTSFEKRGQAKFYVNRWKNQIGG